MLGDKMGGKAKNVNAIWSTAVVDETWQFDRYCNLQYVEQTEQQSRCGACFEVAELSQQYLLIASSARLSRACPHADLYQLWTCVINAFRLGQPFRQETRPAHPAAHESRMPMPA